MKFLRLRKVLLLGLLCFGFASNLVAQQRDSVVIIESKEHFLEWFNESRELHDDDLFWSIILGKNIDLEGASLLPFENFKGNFEGSSCALSNFKIDNSEGGTGLFEDLDGVIRNLCVENATVTSSGNNVGILTGTILAGGIISDCMVINSSVQGKDCVGMIAGVNLGAISKCLVVNGTLTSISKNPAVFLGGIVGKNCVKHVVRNCIVMMDVFRLQTVPSKKGNVGRIAGGKGTLARNFGWGEIGFALYSERSDSYEYRYYPNWTKKKSSLGTGFCKLDAKHGRNFFIGDYSFRVAPAASNIKFWTLLAEFNFDVWTFPQNSSYPKLKNSKISTQALIERRGFEHDQGEYSAVSLP